MESFDKGTSELLTDLNEYVRLANENGITSGGRWLKSYKDIEYPSHRLASQPWRTVSPRISSGEFGKLIRPYEKEYLTDLNEYVRLAKENGIASGRQWLNNGYKKIEYPSHRLASCPWNVVSPKISSTKFGELLSGKMLTDLDEYVRLAKENGITSGLQWTKGYKDIEYPSHRLASQPWCVVSPKISVMEFVKLIRPDENEFLTDLDEYVRLSKENGIISGGQWIKGYKDIEYPSHRLSSSPWDVVYPKISAGEFGKLLRPNEKEILEDKEEYFRIFKENAITSGWKWANEYKNITHHSHRLHSKPWTIFYMSVSEFFKTLRNK